MNWIIYQDFFRLKVAQLKNKNRIDPSHGAKFWNDAIKGGIDKESGPMDMGKQ